MPIMPNNLYLINISNKTLSASKIIYYILFIYIYICIHIFVFCYTVATIFFSAPLHVFFTVRWRSVGN